MIITPLAKVEAAALTLETIADYPLLTYGFDFGGRSQLDVAFKQRGLVPNIVFTATDADVIKAYVRLGLGVGIVAKMAYNQQTDNGLIAKDVSHLFDASVTSIGLCRGTFLRRFVYQFIELFAPHLNRSLVEEVCRQRSKMDVDSLFEAIALPVY